MRKTVCLVLNSPVGGGAERFMVHLMNNLSRDLFEIHLVLLKSQGEYLPLIPKDIPVTDLNIQAFELNKPISPVWIWKLGQAIKRIRPQVVFSTMGSTNLMNTVAKKFLSIKTAVVIREAGILSHHLAGDPLEMIKKIIYKMCVSWADQVTFPAKAMADDLESYLGCSLTKKSLIPNFIDTAYLDAKLSEAWSPDQMRLKTDRKIIISLGRLEKIKGMDLGILAFSQVLKKIPAYYWILGQGAEEEKLKELARHQGIAAQVFFLGFQKNPYPFLKHADVLLLPSRSEGFPNALLEAMYCQVPCVISRFNSSVDEIIQNEREGLVVPAENPAAMAEAVERILRDPGLANQFKQNGRGKAGQFSKEKVIRQYEQLFLNLAA